MESYKREYIDWQIHSTLQLKHPLIGIILPTCSKDAHGLPILPKRLKRNIDTKYVDSIAWNPRWSTEQHLLKTVLKTEIEKSHSRIHLIDNSLPKMILTKGEKEHAEEDGFGL